MLIVLLYLVFRSPLFRLIINFFLIISKKTFSSSVFGVQYYLAVNHVQVKTWKKNHPTMVMVGTLTIGLLLLYQVDYIYEKSL